MNQQQIGKFILESRKKKNITQKELADKIGVTNKAISKWENGRGMPDYSLFQPLCDALDISVTDLLNGKEGDSDAVIVDYLKYKDKQNFKKIFLFTIIAIFTFVFSISFIFFINSYKKINVYELKGRSENFSYENGLIIKSNIKNVIQSGKLSSKTIKDENIYSVSLTVKISDKYYPIYYFLNNTLITEKYGYGEYFTDKTLPYIPEDLYLIIFYEKDEKIVYEELKVENNLIFSNDKIVNKKDKAEYNYNLEPLDFNKYDKIFKLRTKAKQDGFGYNKVCDSYFQISNCLAKELSPNEYVGFDYKDYLGTFSYYIEKSDFILKLDLVHHNNEIPTELVFGFLGNANLITYDLSKDEIICDENLMKYKDYVIKAKDLFLEYYIK